MIKKRHDQWWQNPWRKIFTRQTSSTSANDNKVIEKHRKPVPFWGLFKYGTRSDKISAIIGMVAALIAGTSFVLSFFVTGMIVSSMLLYGKNPYEPKLYSHAMPWVGADLALAIIAFSSSYVQNYCLKLSCANITATLRIKFIESLLQQDAAYMDKQKFGMINQQLSENIDKITNGVGEQIGIFLRCCASIIACIIFALVLSWKATLVYLIVCPITLLFVFLMVKLVSIATRKQELHSEKAASVMQESIINVKTVQSCNGQAQMVDRFRTLLATGCRYAVLNYFWGAFFEAWISLALYFFFVVTFYFNAVSYYNGDIKEPGTVYIVPSSMFASVYLFAINSPSLVSITKARVAAALIYEKIEREALLAKSTNLKDINVTNGRIEFTNVVFSYDNGSKVLNGLSFVANPGETVALVGHSGCGKSTTIALLLRLYEANSGSISIDDMDIRDANFASIRRAVGLVRQEPVLFSGTIADNIRLGDNKITDAQIMDACKITNAHDFIVKLSDGYDTPVGAGCVQLSGGQKQRIAIARAIVDDPKILLLDEATSALDVHSEMHVQAALKAASKGRTTIVIAHRLSTLRDASQIVVLSNGKVIESGTHDELQEHGGVYSDLVKAQEFKDLTPNKDTDHSEVEVDFAAFSRKTNDGASKTSIQSFAARTVCRTDSLAIDPIKISAFYGTKKMNGLWLLFKNCKGQYINLTIGVILSVLRGFEIPMYAFLMFIAMDALEDKGNWATYRDKILTYCGLNLTVGVLSFFLVTASVTLHGWVAECAVDAIKVRFLTSVLKRDGSFFDKPETSNAKLVSMMNSDAPQMKGGLDNYLVLFIINIVSLIVLLILAASFCWEMTVAGFGLSCILFGIMYVCMRYSHARTTSVQAMTTHANLAVEIIENVRTIQLLNREQYFSTRFETAIHEVRIEFVSAAAFESFVIAIGMCACFVADCISYSIGIPLLYEGRLKPGSVFVAAMAINVISWTVQSLGVSGLSLMRAEPACAAIISLLDENIENSGPSSTTSEHEGVSPPIKGSVKAEKIDFAYPARPNIKVANKLSFEAPEGKMIAFVGPSGGGKSTVISLLERFYSFKDGKLTVDDVPVSNFNLHHLRNNIALVGQEPVLFAGSIQDNILLGIDGGTFDDVQKACQMANALEFIEQMPLGYETEVDEKGAMLSGGQKQRIAIARAIARNPRVLLLDEATSALDSECEKAVQEALKCASKARTVISIAHRLSSIQDADKIYLIEGGSVVESGTHTELVSADGKYASLVCKQRLNK